MTDTALHAIGTQTRNLRLLNIRQMDRSAGRKRNLSNFGEVYGDNCREKHVMRYALALVCLSAVLSGVAISQVASPRSVTPDDFYTMQTPGDPQISPDGKLVAYSITSIDRGQNRKQVDLWVGPINGNGPPWQLTSGDTSTGPRWSPDGHFLGFLSARRDPKTGALAKTQVYELPMRGGEPRRITSVKNGVSAFEWSPDGTRLVCVSKIGPSDNVAPGKRLSDVLDYTYAEFKADGSGYYNDQRNHLWVVDVAGGDARQVTFGDQQNDAEPQWSPDGTRISYSGQRTDNNDDYGANGGIFIVPSAGGTPSKLSVSTLGMSSIKWSPNGKQLAYIGSADANYVPKIWTAAVAGGPAVLVSNDVTYPLDIEWGSDGHALYYHAPYEGNVPIFHIDLLTGKANQVISNSTTTAVSLHPASKTMVYTASDSAHPTELFGAVSNGNNARQLTHLNDGLLSKITVQRDEALTFKSVDGWTIEGYFTKPLHWEDGKKYPMILMVHGGPNGMWGSNWNFTEQCFAARGWAVLRINPRGSSGYGEVFQRGVFREFGGKAYQDLMNGVDAALAKYPWVDAKRLGVTGHSYGGFMTNWIIGHTTRFKAAVPQSGMVDFISDDGARDAFYGHKRDFGAQFWENTDLYWRNSPIYYADKVKTPTLFIQGQIDERVPVEQAEEYFRALHHFGIPTELVIFPGEPHSPGKTPEHVNDWMRWQIYWFDRWLDQNTNAIKPNAIN